MDITESRKKTNIRKKHMKKNKADIQREIEKTIWFSSPFLLIRRKAFKRKKDINANPIILVLI